MPKHESDLFFNSRKDENGKTIDRGRVGIRSAEAANAILETMRGLQEAGLAKAK